MNSSSKVAIHKPSIRPADPRFSSGPCKKHPGWDLQQLSTAHLGRSHRAPQPKASLCSAIDRSAALLDLPKSWRLGIVPGSDTGAFEMAMWSLLGSRAVDAYVWENFSKEWAQDLSQLDLPQLNLHQADYGNLPDLHNYNPNNDTVLVYNGTTSGVRLPDLDWIKTERDALVLCDATSAAYAMPIDFSKVDVLTWSWQKVLGGEAAHGMIALSPRAVARLQDSPPSRALPKVFRLLKNQTLIEGIFRGDTINTPSMLVIEDVHSALNWAEQIGGLAQLHARTEANFKALDTWVQKTDWIDWLACDPATRSPTSMCLKITTPEFNKLPQAEQQLHVKSMVSRLEQEGVAYDIANYVNAPPGFRIWGGATVDSTDIEALTHWLDWAYAEFKRAVNDNAM